MRAPATRPTALLGLAFVAAASAIGGCPRGTPAPPSFGVRFVLRDGASPVDCGSTGRFRLEDARFFVSAMRLEGAGGAQALSFVPDGRAQSERVARLDFEDGRGACRSGDDALHTELVVQGRASAGTLSFDLGVPFDENHANPATAAPPLTAGTMHWGWRGGYKFARIEGRLGALPLRVHVGSTGCEGPFTRVSRCAFPNRTRVVLPGYRPGRVVAIDLATLLDAGASDCMGEPSDPACAAAYSALGQRGGPQTLVRWETP